MAGSSPFSETPGEILDGTPNGTADAAADRAEDGLRIELLTPGRAAQAYALARVCNPALTLDDWQEICGGRTAAAGALVVICARNYVRALCRFRTATTARDGLVLDVTDIATGHPLDPARYAPMLLSEAESRARSLGCGAIRILVPQTDDWLETMLLRRGHARKGIIFAKSLRGGETPSPVEGSR